MSTYRYATAPGYQSPYLVPVQMPALPVTFTYLPYYPIPGEVATYTYDMQEPAAYDHDHEMNTRHRSRTRDKSKSTRSRSKRSRSSKRDDDESWEFLDVEDIPVHHRRSASRGHERGHSHCSPRPRGAPSLTHSAHSDDESEGLPASGPTTPYSANVALWRDDVHDSSDEVPPPPIIPPHLKAQHDHAQYLKHQYERPRSRSSSGHSSMVVPRPVPSPAPSDSASPMELGRIQDEINDIDYEINARILSFNFPTSLDFAPTLPNGNSPPLPYTPRNKALIEHRGYLEDALLRMDAIRSYRDSHIRTSRKAVVTKIQDQLGRLNRMEKMVRDNMHYERWKKNPRIHVTPPSESG